MSAQPDFSRESFDEGMRARIHAGEALCAVVETMAVAGRLDLARRNMAQINAILNEATRCVAAGGSSAPDSLAALLDGLRHRARNAETVLKLVE